MLHIILGILKWIGILLLILLLLVLAVMLAVLLVPIRYCGELKKTAEEQKGSIKVTWLLHVISVAVSYDLQARQQSMEMRIFGVCFSDIVAGVKHVAGFFGRFRTFLSAKKRIKREKQTANTEKNRDCSKTTGDLCTAEKGSQESVPEESAQDSGTDSDVRMENSEDPVTDPDVQIKDSENPKADSDAQVKDSGAPDAGSNAQKENFGEPGTDSDVRMEDSGAPDAGSNTQMESPDERTDSKESEISQEKSSGGRKHPVHPVWAIREFIKNFIVQVQALKVKGKQILEKLSEIICRTENIPEKIGRLCERASDGLKMLETYEVFEVAGTVKSELFSLLKHYRPRKISGYLHFGTGDPAQTGQLLGLLYLLLPVRAEKLSLEPEFTETVFETELVFLGRIRPCHVVGSTWRLFRDKKLRRLIRKVRRRDI